MPTAFLRHDYYLAALLLVGCSTPLVLLFVPHFLRRRRNAIERESDPPRLVVRADTYDVQAMGLGQPEDLPPSSILTTYLWPQRVGKQACRWQILLHEDTYEFLDLRRYTPSLEHDLLLACEQLGLAVRIVTCRKCLAPMRGNPDPKCRVCGHINAGPGFHGREMECGRAQAIHYTEGVVWKPGDRF